MTQAEKEIIEAFCRELALALRRITGRVAVIPQLELPVESKDVDQGDDANSQNSGSQVGGV